MIFDVSKEARKCRLKVKKTASDLTSSLFLRFPFYSAAQDLPQEIGSGNFGESWVERSLKLSKFTFQL